MNNNEYNPDHEFAALAQGKLPATALGRVRRQLARELRRSRRDTRTLLQCNGIDVPRIESAPVSLRNRLRAIPGPTGRDIITPLRLGMSSAVAAVMIALLLAYNRPPQDNVPSAADIAQARAELAIAFSYVQQISRRTDYYMKREIGHTMQDAIINGIFLGVTNKPDKG